jgi:hypothetical protein
MENSQPHLTIHRGAARPASVRYIQRRRVKNQAALVMLGDAQYGELALAGDLGAQPLLP